MKWLIVLSVLIPRAENIEVYTSTKSYETKKECTEFLHTDAAMESIQSINDRLTEKYGKDNYSINVECMEDEKEE